MKLSNEYIRGLVEGEGCFTFHTRDGKKNGKKIKEKSPAFALSMNERDKELIEAVRDNLSLKNKVYIHKPYKGDGYNRGNRATLVVRAFGSLKNIIIPFFYKRLKGNKANQFDDWLKKIGEDPLVGESYKILYRLYKNGYWDRNPKFLD